MAAQPIKTLNETTNKKLEFPKPTLTTHVRLYFTYLDAVIGEIFPEKLFC